MSAVLQQLGTHRAVAILRCAAEQTGRQAVAAAVRGGFRVVEVTLSTPGALRLLSELSADSALLVGAGTVLTVAQAEQAVAAGARFIVSPVLDRAVVDRGRQLGALVIPGVCTPTEMWQATCAGAEVLKLFPATDKGPSYVAACLGPLPELRIMPTSGVTVDNAAAFLRAGAFALGFVKPLFDPAELERSDWQAVEQRARRIIELLRSL